MTQNESNLLMALFLAKHKGKQSRDIFKDHRFNYIVEALSFDSIDGILSVVGTRLSATGEIIKESILWYSPSRKCIRRADKVQLDYITVNLLDYISFEDKV